LKRSLRLIDYEAPLIRRDRILERDAVVCNQVAWMLGYAAPLKVGRACAHHTPHSADLLSHQPAVEKRADADRNVDAIFDQVQAAVGKLEAGVNAWVFLQEVNDKGQKIEPPKRDRRRQHNLTFWRSVFTSCIALCFAKIADDPAAGNDER